MSSSQNKSLGSTLHGYEKQLDTMLSKYPAILKIERKVGVPKARLVLGLGGLIVGYALLQVCSGMLTGLVIFGYPAFMTMKAIESNQKTEHSLWLAYWVSAAMLQLLEAFTFGSLEAVVPFYAFLKIALHMYLYLPMTQGGLTIYESLLRPTFKQLVSNPQFAAAQDKFASAANKATADANKLAADAKKATQDALKKTASSLEALSKDD